MPAAAAAVANGAEAIRIAEAISFAGAPAKRSYGPISDERPTGRSNETPAKRSRGATTTNGAAAAAPAAAQPPSAVAYTLEADLTWTGSAFERGVLVAVDLAGRIAEVKRPANPAENGHGPNNESRSGAVVRLRGRALVPGFVNAHSHAFQRGMRGRGESYPQENSESSFWTWRQAMYTLVDGLGAEGFRSLTTRCFAEMAAAGITTVGEFHYFHHASGDEVDFSLDDVVVEAAREANVRVVLLNAYYQHADSRQLPLGAQQRRFRKDSLDAYWKQMDRLAAKLDASRGEALGVVAHSMRAVDVPTLQALHAEARRRSLVFHMQLEEQPKEIEDCKKAHEGKTPMQVLLESVPLAGEFTAVHCTHTVANEMASFLARGANVCICPLTEGSLGDGVFSALAEAKGRVCLGTDCNARIDMLEEMRWLEYSQRLHRLRRGAYAAAGGESELGRQLLRCATEFGAKALGLDAGRLAPGLWADFALLDLDAPSLAGCSAEDLLPASIFGASAEGVVVDSCVAGRWRRLPLAA